MRFNKRSTTFICAATDGLELVAIRFQGWEPFMPFFRPLEDFMNYIPEVENKTQEKTENTVGVDSNVLDKQIDIVDETNTKKPTQTKQEILQETCDENSSDLSEAEKNKNVQEQNQQCLYLDNFLNSDNLNARTNDDKTLLLCLYQPNSDSKNYSL